MGCGQRLGSSCALDQPGMGFWSKPYCHCTPFWLQARRAAAPKHYGMDGLGYMCAGYSEFDSSAVVLQPPVCTTLFWHGCRTRWSRSWHAVLHSTRNLHCKPGEHTRCIKSTARTLITLHGLQRSIVLGPRPACKQLLFSTHAVSTPSKCCGQASANHHGHHDAQHDDQGKQPQPSTHGKHAAQRGCC